VAGIDGRTLEALYAGDVATFADGTPAVMLLRDPDESANAALEATMPRLRALREGATRIIASASSITTMHG